MSGIQVIFGRLNITFAPLFPQAMLSLPKMTWMPDITIASGGGGGRKYVIFTGYRLYVPRVLARVVDMQIIRSNQLITWLSL